MQYHSINKWGIHGFFMDKSQRRTLVGAVAAAAAALGTYHFFQSDTDAKVVVSPSAVSVPYHDLQRPDSLEERVKGEMPLVVRADSADD